MNETTFDQLTKGQKTAQKILEAAARCISKVGVEKTSVTNIAKEADLKRSLIAYHFPQKSQIFYKVIQHISNEILLLRQVNTQNTVGREKLEKILKTFSDFFYENPHYFNCFLHFQYMSSIDDEYRRLNDQTMNNALSTMSAAILEILASENLQLNKDLAYDFAETLYMRLSGTIMRYYTTNHGYTSSQYQNHFTVILKEEINLFVSFAKSKVTLL